MTVFPRRRFSCAHSRLMHRKRVARRVIGLMLVALAVVFGPQVQDAWASAKGSVDQGPAQALADEVGSHIALDAALDGTLPTALAVSRNPRTSACGLEEIGIERGIPCDAIFSIHRTNNAFTLTVFDGGDTAIYRAAVS